MNIAKVREEHVRRVYSGKQGCMCGCIGKYFVNPLHRAEADAERGYPHEDDEMRPHMVRRILRRLQSDPRVRYEDGMFFVPRHALAASERDFVVYLTKDATERRHELFMP